MAFWGVCLDFIHGLGSCRDRLWHSAAWTLKPRPPADLALPAPKHKFWAKSYRALKPWPATGKFCTTAMLRDLLLPSTILQVPPRHRPCALLPYLESRCATGHAPSCSTCITITVDAAKALLARFKCTIPWHEAVFASGIDIVGCLNRVTEVCIVADPMPDGCSCCVRT